MRKAIRLQVTLWVEGEHEPAHDFLQSTLRAVRDVIKNGSRAHPELRFTVKRVAEDSES
jgi:hypothetical protein